VVPAPAQARPIAPERQGKEYLALAGRIDPQDAKERCALLVTIDRGCRWSPEATMRLRYVRRIGRNRRDMLAVVMPATAGTAIRSASVKGANLWKASFIAPPSRFESEHPREHLRCPALGDGFEIGDQRHRIAALVARSEVRPAACSQIDFEAFRASYLSAWGSMRHIRRRLFGRPVEGAPGWQAARPAQRG
jgi:hypothetical protein